MDDRIFLVDSREPALIKLKMSLASPIKSEVKALSSADYVITDVSGRRLGIERKSVSDFLNSMAKTLKNGEKRMFDQLRRMREEYDLTALLLEGDWRVDKTKHLVIGSKVTGWYITPFQNALWSIQEHGTKLIRTTDMNTTVMTVMGLVERGRVKEL